MSIIKEKYEDVIRALNYEVYIDGRKSVVVYFSQDSGLWYCDIPSLYNELPVAYLTMEQALNTLQECLREYCNVHSLELPLKYSLGQIIDGPMIVTTIIRADGKWSYKGLKLSIDFID